VTISEFEVKRTEKALDQFLSKRRPPVHIREEVDLAYRITSQSVELFEIRPKWDDASTKIEHPAAKATYVKRQECWKVFWFRADEKWHAYEPIPTVKLIEDFLGIVDEDKHGCFFG
jgi:hypothetical protein